MLRSCRPHVLEAALAAVRAACPGARITALTHAGYRDALRTQGVDAVVEVCGARFGVAQTPLRTLAALRAERFDMVLVPVMAGDLPRHLNLVLLALATGARSIAMYTQESGLRPRSRLDTLYAATQHWRGIMTHRFDVPLALCLMALATVMRRRRRAEAEGPRRVLHIITSWGVGGAQRQLAELIRHCPAASYTPELFVLARSDGDFSSQHLRGHHVRIHYSESWPQLAPTILEIAKLCRSQRYDVVHTWLFLANALGVAAARLAGTPRVISSVRNLSLWKRTWANRPWFRLADTLASRASDVVTVNATSLVADHASWGRMRQRDIAVVPNGLSPEGLDLNRDAAGIALRAQLGLAPDVRIVGTVGRLAPEKAHGLLLDAWTHARAERAHLVIVGDGPLRPTLQARIGAVGHGVTLLGEADQARRVMAGFDLFVLPSQIEGFPNVLLEATMLGVPVVATDIGAARDMIGDDEDLVPVGNAGALATRLAAHLHDLDGPRRRAARRRAFVRQTFTVNRMVERWLALYSRS